jgi:hypothetical protein
VSDFTTNQIFVFAAGSTGNTAPIRTISGSKTQLNEPLGMAVNSSGRLFVANGKSSTKPIVEPMSVSLDSTGRIIVPSNANSVLIFSKGSKGYVAPAAIITGSKTNLMSVSSAGVDASDEIFVTECCPTGGAIYVFASTASGNVSPIRSIVGSKTQLDDSFYPSFH